MSNNSNQQQNIMFIVLPHIIRNIRDAKNPKTRSYKAFPYGVLSVATYLKNNTNHLKIKIIDCNIYDNLIWKEIIKKELNDFKPDIVGLSMSYDNAYKYLKDISRMIKKYNNKIIIVLGGAAASFSYDEIIKEQDYIDGICYTEGELPLLRLINSKNKLELLENDKSFITKKSISIRIPEKSFVTNLDDVTNIDYDLIDIKEYKMMQAFSPFIGDDETLHEKNKKQFFLLTSRGCPFKCIFCSTCTGLYNNKIRYASVDKVVDHVKYLVEKYSCNVITFYDDQLLLNKKRAKEIFRRLAKFNLRIECPNGLSPMFIDDELAYLMRNAGMDTIILAIEHGSEYMLKKIIHKPLSIKMVKPIVQTLRKYDFFIEAFFVIGIPGEKEEHRNETLNFIRDVRFDWCGFNLATPLRGSELYNICIKNGYIDKNLKIGDIEDKKYIIKTPDLDPDYINKKTYLMNLDVNFVNNYRMSIGDYQMAANCFQDVIRRTTNHAFAYYYLAKAYEAMNDNPEAIKSNMSKFYEIIKEDNIWKEYSQHFGII